MTNLRILILLLLLSFILSPTVANEPNTVFYQKTLSNNDGLSNSSVTTIFQDHQDILWIGTWDGLNRYDGSSIKQYRPQSDVKHSLSHHVIRSIQEDADNYLWIVTDYGINRMNKADDTFEHYFLGYENSFIYQEESFACAVSNDNHIVATFRGSKPYIFDKEKNEFVPSHITGAKGYTGARKIFFDTDNFLWILEQNGTLLKTQILPSQEIEVINETVLPKQIEKIFYDHRDRIWFSQNDRLCFMNLQGGTPGIQSTDIKLNGVLNDIVVKNDGIIIGTSDGCITSYKGDLQLSNKGISILSLYAGSQDIIWLGTDGKGLIQQYYVTRFIKTYDFNNIISNTGKYPIRSILKDQDGDIWIGSKGGGLSRIKGERVVQSFNVGGGKTYNSVLSMAESADCIWIGTDGTGIKYYDKKAQQIRQLDLSGSPLRNKIYSVYSIIEYDPHTLFIGSSGEGLFKISIDNDKRVADVVQYKHTGDSSNTINCNIIFDILKDGPLLWIATRGGGLNLYNTADNTFTSLKHRSGEKNSLCSNDVISLHKDSQGRLWIGTSSGLSVMTTDANGNRTFETLNEKAGLPNSNIHSIEEDYNHNIWVSTSNGIAQISPENKEVINYYYEDGLQDNEFADGASFSDPNSKEIFFGGINGFNIIYTDLITPKEFTPQIIITGITIDNKQVVLSDQTIYTDYKNSVIDIALSVTDYIDNKKCNIAYKLIKKGEKVDDNRHNQWINIGNARNIILNKFPTGKYKLYIKSSNAGQVWTEDIVLNIIKTPPLWASGWAIALYIVIFVVVIRLFYKNKKSKLLIRHALEMEKQEKIKKEEIYQAKLRFFTNIAHEFSNSITLIYGAIEQIFAMQSTDSKAKKQLLSIHQNAERMHKQIQELMEFRKADTGHLKEQLEEIDINELVRCTCDNFLDIAESKGIKLETNLQNDLPTWVADKSMLEKVVFNLLSNAIKYTPNEGSIIINVTARPKELFFEIKNSGVGIKPEDLPNIFNRFTILDNYENTLSQGLSTRNGIGLALCKDLVKLMGGTIQVSSTPNEFTTFSFTIPQKEIVESNIIKENLPEVVEKAPSYFDQQKPTILIVDDKEEIINLIKDILSDSYETIGASNGVEAINIMKETIPSLIICDMVMPRMNGSEFISKIKEHKETKYIPIIILSSKSSIENQITMLETGASFFINKPFHPQYLKAAVERLLHNKDLMKSFYESPIAYKEKYNNTLISKEDKAFIDKAIEILSMHYYDENYNQDSLAKDLMVSRIQLYRKIKQIAQATPGEFIRSYRLKQAENMLIHTDKTVQEIMIECGFHNKAYFYKEFAKAYNCSPKDFRNKRNKE